LPRLDVDGTPVENPPEAHVAILAAIRSRAAVLFPRDDRDHRSAADRALLLIGGTASIVGEDSLHEGDAGAQLEETLKNLEALIDTACGEPARRPRSAA
jgi:hypothetical protein